MSHFSAVFIHNFAESAKKFMVLVVSDVRFPKDVKMPGGMAEIVSGNCRLETPEETARREAISETGVQLLGERLIHTEVKIGRHNGQKHLRYFYIAEKVSALPPLDMQPRSVREMNSNDRSVEDLICFWLPLREMAQKLFKEQHPAFGAILAELAMDPAFFEEFGDLLTKFPAPVVKKED